MHPPEANEGLNDRGDRRPTSAARLSHGRRTGGSEVDPATRPSSTHGMAPVRVRHPLGPLSAGSGVFLFIALVAGLLGQAGPTPPFPYPYPMDGAIDASWPLDANGIVMVPYDVMAPYASALGYNPVTVAQYALRYYDLWTSQGLAGYRSMFFKYADWLIDHQAPDGFWYYTFPFGPLTPPWVSAMAEGQAISVLARAYHFTRQLRYLSAARLALATFDLRAGAGGVTTWENGNPFYEEYPPPWRPHTLNGMIFAMYGLRDAALEWDDPHAIALWHAGISTLVSNLSRWDAGDWSYYALASPPEPASRFYQGIHVELMHELAAITGHPVFSAMGERWARDLASPPPGR